MKCTLYKVYSNTLTFIIKYKTALISYYVITAGSALSRETENVMIIFY